MKSWEERAKAEEREAWQRYQQSRAELRSRWQELKDHWVVLPRSAKQRLFFVLAVLLVGLWWWLTLFFSL